MVDKEVLLKNNKSKKLSKNRIKRKRLKCNVSLKATVRKLIGKRFKQQILADCTMKSQKS
jgi:hypothetical protein